MDSETLYDELLFPVLSSEGNIIGFFDRIFEFLYRRTDFFKIKTDESSELGLVAGEAEKIVRSVFCKYMEQAVTEHRNQSICEIENVPLDYAAEETVVTTTEPDLEINSTVSIEEVTALNKNRSSNPAEKQVEDQPDVKVHAMDTDCYNGASYDSYSWAQTIKDTDIRIRVPYETTSGKQVRVNIKQTHLTAELCIEDEWTVLKEGDLSFKINVEESTWTLVPHEHIHICLQKIQERWWDSFFVEEPKIDLRGIDSSIAYEELDQESRSKIQELMYNEHMKRLGKPNIQQSKLQNILKEAWDREGSPFKGQPFDPTVVDVQNSGNFDL